MNIYSFDLMPSKPIFLNVKVIKRKEWLYAQ